MKQYIYICIYQFTNGRILLAPFSLHTTFAWLLPLVNNMTSQNMNEEKSSNKNKRFNLPQVL